MSGLLASADAGADANALGRFELLGGHCGLLLADVLRWFLLCQAFLPARTLVRMRMPLVVSSCLAVTAGFFLLTFFMGFSWLRPSCQRGRWCGCECPWSFRAAWRSLRASSC